MPTLLAVPVALAAAASFGSAGYLQHRAAQHAPPRGPLRPRLIWDLLKDREFRWSIVLSAAAFALQVWALSLAPLALVQPLLLTQLILYLLLVSFRVHRVPDRWLLVGAVLASAGLALFLASAHPAPGPADPRVSGTGALVAGLVLVGVVAAALIAAARVPSEWRAVALAAACAVCYGVTAAFIRTLTTTDLSSLLSRWELWAIIGVAPMGFLLNQNAFQNGLLGSVAVSTITVGDPIVSIALGASWLGETLTVGALWTTLQVIGLLVTVGGVLLLTHRAQLVAEHSRARQKDPEPEG